MFFFFQKNGYFLGHEDFVELFEGHYKILLVLGVISMFLAFSYAIYIYRMWL